MNKKDEALKLALECIEAWDRGCNASDYWRDRFDAITAIREALAEQPAQPKCNPHPKAPHGFDRNASHSADRYVCECEGWDAYDAGHQAGFEKGLMSWEDEHPAQQHEHEFKNFHRMLCERFGYTHDERDWRRDQISLIEWIAKKVEQPAQQQEPVQETAWQALPAGPTKVLHQCRAALIGPVADGLARRCAVAAIDAELARPAQNQCKFCIRPNCEALKLALEALESCEMSNYGRDWVWPATAHKTAMKNVKEAITAIREALAEQPAQQPVSVTDELVEAYCWAWAQSFVTNNPYHTVKMTTEDRKHIAAGLRAALADQPAQQQEPVAWLYQYKPAGTRFVTLEMASAINHQQVRETPLYTSPPASKPWVGLSTSDLDEIDAPIRERGSATIAEIYRAIEAKLKEKNAWPPKTKH